MANLGHLVEAAIHSIPPNPIDELHQNYGTAVSTFVHDLNAIPVEPCFGQVVSEAVQGVVPGSLPIDSGFFLL